MSPYKSVNRSSELILRVPVLDHRNLRDSLSSLQKPRLFNDLVRVDGRMEDAVRQCRYGFGPVVLVQPERVVFNARTFSAEKLCSRWAFPEFLDLAQAEKCELKVEKYELRAVLTHLGTASAGHYVVYLNHRARWYRVSDAAVEAVARSEVFSQTGTDGATPCLLLYRVCGVCAPDFIPDDSRYLEQLVAGARIAAAARATAQ